MHGCLALKSDREQVTQIFILEGTLTMMYASSCPICQKFLLMRFTSLLSNIGSCKWIDVVQQA